MLSMSFSYQKVQMGRNKDAYHEMGRTTEAYDGEHFSVGLEYSVTIADGEYTEFVIGTRKIWIHADDVAALFGKRLILDRVGVGVPRPADKTVQLLLAVDL